jgi:hypothetical protein
VRDHSLEGCATEVMANRVNHVSGVPVLEYSFERVKHEARERKRGRKFGE